MLAFIQSLGFPELLVVLVIVLLLFGAGRLPEIAKAMGKSLKEFKKGVNEIEKETDEIKQKVNDDKKS
jgi:TatA/E family protein of Tat protein translocase